MLIFLSITEFVCLHIYLKNVNSLSHWTKISGVKFSFQSFVVEFSIHSCVTIGKSQTYIHLQNERHAVAGKCAHMGAASCCEKKDALTISKFVQFDPKLSWQNNWTRYKYICVDPLDPGQLLFGASVCPTLPKPELLSYLPTYDECVRHVNQQKAAVIFKKFAKM